jgi:protein-disulfide isomerase
LDSRKFYKRYFLGLVVDEEAQKLINESEKTDTSEGFKSRQDDVVEIPVGKFGTKIRENPWIVATIVLGLALLIVLIFNSSGSDVTGNVISQDEASIKVVEFITSNPQFEGDLNIVSVEEQSGLYQTVLNYQGQDVPVYITKDGNFIATGLIPLSNDIIGDNVGNVGGPGEIVEASEDDDAVLGSADAPVTIIEFSDYQCPFCQRFWADTYPQIKKNYIDNGKVKLVFRDFPLVDIHPLAMDSAIAAECVREFGGDSAYFEYHDLVFAKQPDLSYENLIKWASDLGYDISDCLDNEDYLDEVLEDMNDGRAAGVTGTPSFVINGRVLSGALPYSDFEKLIDAALREA